MRSKPTLSVLMVAGAPADRAALHDASRTKRRVIRAQRASPRRGVRALNAESLLYHMRPQLNGMEMRPGCGPPISSFLLSKESRIRGRVSGRFPLDVWPVSTKTKPFLSNSSTGRGDGAVRQRRRRAAAAVVRAELADDPRVASTRRRARSSISTSALARSCAWLQSERPPDVRGSA